MNVHPLRNFNWNSIENQREFLQGLADKYQIHHPRDWRRVTYSLLCKHGGRVRSLLFDNKIGTNNAI